jgi:hypothetical protein
MPTYSQILGYPDDAGYAHSWSSVEVEIAGIKKVVATKSLKYSDPLQIGKGWGTSPRKIIRTRGQSDPTGTWEVYRSAWDMIMGDVLSLGAGKIGFGEVSLPIFVSYREPSNPLLTVQDKLLGVRIHSPEGGGQEGTDPLTITLQLDIMEIVWGARKGGAPGYMQLSPFSQVVSSVPTP